MSDFTCDLCRKPVGDCLCGASRDEKQIAELETDNRQLRKLNSDYKQQIHTLRQRCESLTKEMESLRNEIARLKGQTCCKETP